MIFYFKQTNASLQKGLNANINKQDNGRGHKKSASFGAGSNNIRNSTGNMKGRGAMTSSLGGKQQQELPPVSNR